jgi:hypothetical protein
VWPWTNDLSAVDLSARSDADRVCDAVADRQIWAAVIERDYGDRDYALVISDERNQSRPFDGRCTPNAVRNV